MDLQAVKEWIAAGDTVAVESAWLEALAAKAPPAEMAPVIEAMVATGHKESASTLAWMLLEERADLPPAELLEVAKLLVTAIPESDELRARTAELYRLANAPASKCVEGLLAASGLGSGQSPRRALRTLDLCLGLTPGGFLASRFEGRVVRAGRFDETLGQFELVDEAGRKHLLEPKLLADEYEAIDPRDFRVMVRYQPAEVKEMLSADPAGVLIGLCLSRGGKMNANDIKDFLTVAGRFLTPEEWSDWWGRARTAAKRSPVLTLEGRSPIMVVYHPGGRTLEEEMAGAVEAARTPKDLHSLLQQYLREVKSRKLKVVPAFAGPVTERLAKLAREYLHRRPLDALTAALAVQMGVRGGAPAPAEACPVPADVLAAAQKPADVLAELDDGGLWSAGLEALSARDDAVAQLRRLLAIVPAWRLDDVVARLPAGEADEGVAAAVAEALADPARHIEAFLWLWQGPASPPAGLPSRVDLLSRLLRALADLIRQWDIDAPRRKELWQRVRGGLAVGDYAAFRAAAEAMDEHVAATIKRQLERMEGLAQTVRENMLQVLKERFPALFFTRERVNPWEDEGSIWTSAEALQRRETEYKNLIEITIPANARAIGSAAAHGDLSENSEWKFAIEERDMLEARRAKMAEEFARSRVIQPGEISTETVSIGSRVHLRRLSDGGEVVMSFLGPWEGNPEKGIYSYQTKMAQDLMGRSLGEEVVLKLEGEEEAYRIERIGPAIV